MAPSGQKLKNVLKTAALLPAKAVKGRSNFGRFRSRSRQAFTPLPGETPIVILRIQVIGCTNLHPKDRGTNYPFVAISLLHSKYTTPTCKRTINPAFPAREATFDFPIYLSVVERRASVGALELVVWDRDNLLKKEYLGEAAVGVDGWFPDGDNKEWEKVLAWDAVDNKPISLPLESTRANTSATGSVEIKVGFVSPPNTTNLMDFDEVFRELKKKEARRASWVSAPPTQGVGTIRSHPAQRPGGPAIYEDDGGLSSAEEYEEGEESDAVSEGSEVEGEGELDIHEGSPAAAAAVIPRLTIQQPPESPTTPTTPKVMTPGTAMPPSLAQALTPPTATMPKPQPAEPKSSTKPAPAPVVTITASAPPSPLITSKSSTGFIPKMKFSRKKPTEPPSPCAAASPTLTESPVVEAEDKKKSKEKILGFKKRWSTGNQLVLPSLPVETAGEAQSAGGGDGSVSETSTTVDTAPVTPLTPVVAVTLAPLPAPASAPTRRKRRKDYQFEAGNDIVGIVMLEIIKAEDLPRLKNVTRTGFDMDPFVVISFGKKVFRTRVLRHTLNPIWDEKLLFHVRRYETAYQVQLTILDWDKLSSNDLIGETSFDVKTLVDTSPQPDPDTGLYAPDYGGDHPMQDMTLDLILERGVAWEAQGSKPTITIRAKYQSYAALRQRFWRQYLKQYDVDDTSTISQIELVSMLDSLGSTLTGATIESFFERYGKKMETDELTIDEAIQCLESELGKPVSERKRVDVSEEGRPSVSATPILSAMDHIGHELAVDFEGLDFSGRPAHPNPQHQTHEGLLSGFLHHQHQIVVPQYTTEPSQIPLSAAHGVYSSEEEESGASSGTGGSSLSPVSAGRATTDTEAVEKKSRFRRIRRKKKASANDASSPSTPTATSDTETVPFERVINVKSCPLCHRPRLNSKVEMDIVTHLAVCASQDWAQVDRIVVGNFVTASQAQRKWYTNIWEKISAGNYKLGANSANIIVQNRITGQLEEEKMQVYVRLGIRLLYKGATGRMETSRVRRLLKSLSIKQGVKYDSPESAKEIPTFIHFHQLNVDELLDPLDSFKSFNEFFYRKLKPTARPVEDLDDPYRLVSAADCRLMTFETVAEATKLWIKGREFTVARLLGEAYKDEVDKYTGGALGIFRLAPQDYHRFHSPVDGKIGRMTYIPGEYYTVNPQAIRSTLDVYGENARKIVPIDSPQFGRVMAVCIGAMMVGSIETTVDEGQEVRRGQEFGYFAFGGSTIVFLFEKDVLVWDEDLLVNARASLETLVRVGMGIGKGRRPASA